VSVAGVKAAAHYYLRQVAAGSKLSECAFLWRAYTLGDRYNLSTIPPPRASAVIFVLKRMREENMITQGESVSRSPTPLP